MCAWGSLKQAQKEVLVNLAPLGMSRGRVHAVLVLVTGVGKDAATDGEDEHKGREKEREKVQNTSTKTMVGIRTSSVFYLRAFLGVVARGARASGAACVGDGGRGGVCLVEEECLRGGGTPSLPCNAEHYAVCCVAFVRGCGGETVTNRTYWTHPARLTGGTTCTLHVQKISTAICYLRLDFHVFQLAPPTLGHCNRDHLALFGQNINSVVPRLCGTNSGQHLYVGVGRVLGPVELMVTTQGEEPGRRWEIEVTQVECCGEGTPPDGCLQYYASSHGSFASFNYLPNGSSQYLNNLNYAVCVARAAAFCSITYTAGDKMDNTTFQMVNFSLRNDLLTPTVTPGEAGVGVVPCRGDYVVMAGTRLCGDRLNDGSVEPQPTDNGPVTDSTSGPFLVQVMSDSQFTGRGFNLTYHLNPC
ncbi:uncharacterized protein LOC123501651 isoform X1 [Portunus trituberculatus]|uniref:uncharacterized protein LOC123501651 isoform X1 n=2 Tax=Portunus trituberculatus TaxID=210409 RepID=UPI001E1CD1F4|nr:uncharacterized protein LOC123501651 isoform X1 [Portunus trituberculatus]